ncbi:MAG TPA: hypothetical protein VMV53_02680 [Acidimicrobiales bacterium]|nr:hypothetical protein [Acidimicrobiales bacterium]
MPRNAKDTTMAALRVAIVNHERSLKAEQTAKDRKYAAMVRAVVAGNSRGAVAREAHITGQRVAQIPGMPKGKNAARRDVE